MPQSIGSPAYNALTRVLMGAEVPSRLLSILYQSIAILRNVDPITGSIGEELETRKPVATSRRSLSIKRNDPLDLLPSW